MSKVSTWVRRTLGVPEINITDHPLYPLLLRPLTQTVARQVVEGMDAPTRALLLSALQEKEAFDVR